MNSKRAQSMGLAIMGLIFFVIVGFSSINFFFDEVDTARLALSCASTDEISDGSKLVCLMVDLSIPYWIWIILSVGVGFVLVRLAL